MDSTEGEPQCISVGPPDVIPDGEAEHKRLDGLAASRPWRRTIDYDLGR